MELSCYFVCFMLCTELTHSMPLFTLLTPPPQKKQTKKPQKTKGFVIFLGGIESDQWHEMG